MEKWRYKTAKDIALGPKDRAFSVERETTLISAVTQFLSWTTIGCTSVYTIGCGSSGASRRT
jgi:fructoselysine-6-P-deglycase FrlB-like protein